MVWFLGGATMMCLAMVIIMSLLPPEWKDSLALWGMSKERLVLHILGISVMGLVLYGFFYIGKRYDQVCPHCKKSIQGVLTHIAIATGKCGQCGETIIEV